MNATKGTHLHTFRDGSELHISTTYSGEEEFACDLFVFAAGKLGRLEARSVSDTVVAKTCGEAQRLMYARIENLYPAEVKRIKAPPYLISCGPGGFVERARPGWQQRKAKGRRRPGGVSFGGGRPAAPKR